MTGNQNATEPDRASAGQAIAATVSAPRSVDGLVGKALWSALDFWVQQAVALLVFLVIGNIVGPAAVGVLTIAQLGVTLMMTLLLDGFADALIQRPRLEPAHFDTAFALLTGLGVLAGLALWLLSPAYAALFREPELRQILPLLAIGLPLLGLAVVYQALLQRELRFRALALRSVVAQSAAFAVALAMAHSGAGIHALIGYFLVVRGLDAVLLALMARRLPGLNLRHRALSDVVGYGKHRLGNQILGFVVTQIDRVTAGLFLGPVIVGLYSLAERVTAALTGGLSGVVGRVGFAAFSARQAEPEALRHALHQVLLLGNLLAMPAFLGVFAVSGDLVGTLFSPAWSGVAPVLAVLALAGVPQTTNYVLTAAINARGRPDIALRYSLVIMALRLAVSLAAARHGILALAQANLAVTLGSCLIVLVSVRHQLPGAPSLALRAMGVPAAAATGMVVITWSVAAALPEAAPATLLCTRIAAGAVGYAALLLLLAPRRLVRLLRGAI